MNEETRKRIKNIRKKSGKNSDIEFLVLELITSDLKLQNADILAMTVDTAIKRGGLDSRSLVGDARLNYGQPWKYEHATKKQLLSYKGGIPEIKKVLES